MLDLNISRISIADSVTQKIRQMIMNRELSPGDKLPSQRDLAVQLGVGKQTIREALKSLVSMGLIRVAHGRSTIVERVGLETLISGVSSVLEITDVDVLSLLEAKDIIETRCAELAALRSDSEELKRMKEDLDRMEMYRDDISKYAAADYDYHYTIINAARNKIINEIMKIVGRMIEKAIEKTVLGSGVVGRELAMQYHYQIYEAIKSRKAKLAGKLVHEHLMETIDRYSNILRSKEMIVP